MDTRPAAGPELQLQGLRDHLPHLAGEVQREQNLRFLQTLEAVMPPCADHVLKPGPVALPPMPRKPANRPDPGKLNLGKVPDRHDQFAASEVQGDHPATSPAIREIQILTPRDNRCPYKQVVPAAAV